MQILDTLQGILSSCNHSVLLSSPPAAIYMLCLQHEGLIGLREQVNPGHGVVQIVEPVAQKFDMRVTL